MNHFLQVSYSEPRYFALLTTILFAVIFLRYLVVSGIYHYLFFVAFPKHFQNRMLHEARESRRQWAMEIYRSALGSLVFAVFGTVMVILWQKGHTRIYTGIRDYPLWYIPLSIAAALFLHETYYYWLHRWMHRPLVYRWVHKWHHDSIHTSSMTAFSFHPIESALQAVVVPALVLIIPLHIGALFFLLIFMTLSGTINHAGIEVYPRHFERHAIGKWIIGATHHDVHHKQFRYNFGLYFTFWDRWMKTESPKFEERFREKTKPMRL